MSKLREPLRQAVSETLQLAQASSDQTATVVMVGGSSRMHLVASEVRQVCPEARTRHADAFTAVVDGLAVATTATFRSHA